MHALLSFLQDHFDELCFLRYCQISYLRFSESFHRVIIKMSELAAFLYIKAIQSVYTRDLILRLYIKTLFTLQTEFAIHFLYMS